MKKIIILLFLFFPIVARAEKIEVKLQKCVDGDTAYFIKNEQQVKTRFLAIDTPETKHPTKGLEPYGKEASEFTCNNLKKASKIELEYEDNEKTDKYNRDLVWVFVDNQLLQDLLVQKGYAQVAYLYDDYKYTSLLQNHESIAKNNQLGIWGDYKEKDNTLIYIIIVIGIIFFCLISKKFRKKTINKARRRIKDKIKKRI